MTFDNVIVFNVTLYIEIHLLAGVVGMLFHDRTVDLLSASKTFWSEKQLAKETDKIFLHYLKQDTESYRKRR